MTFATVPVVQFLSMTDFIQGGIKSEIYHFFSRLNRKLRRSFFSSNRKSVNSTRVNLFGVFHPYTHAATPTGYQGNILDIVHQVGNRRSHYASLKWEVPQHFSGFGSINFKITFPGTLEYQLF